MTYVGKVGKLVLPRTSCSSIRYCPSCVRCRMGDIKDPETSSPTCHIVKGTVRIRVSGLCYVTSGVNFHFHVQQHYMFIFYLLGKKSLSTTSLTYTANFTSFLSNNSATSSAEVSNTWSYASTHSCLHGGVLN
jgi:hypothetical protein